MGLIKTAQIVFVYVSELVSTFNGDFFKMAIDFYHVQDTVFDYYNYINNINKQHEM